MADMPKVRKLLESITTLAPHMTDEEVNGMCLVLMKVTDRLLKESGGSEEA